MGTTGVAGALDNKAVHSCNQPSSLGWLIEVSRLPSNPDKSCMSKPEEGYCISRKPP